jgi:hypothetical protein
MRYRTVSIIDLLAVQDCVEYLYITLQVRDVVFAALSLFFQPLYLLNRGQQVRDRARSYLARTSVPGPALGTSRHVLAFRAGRRTTNLRTPHRSER